MPQTSSAATQAQEGIIEYIRSNHLSAGDILPSEAVLCDELGFSRTSIREAMRTLSSLDIVEVRHGHGTYVSEMSLSPLVRGMVLRIMLSSADSLPMLEHVVDVRSTIDYSVAEELAQQWNEVDTQELEGIVGEMRAAGRAGRPFLEEDRRFHQALLENVSNPLLREFSDAFWEIHMEVVPQLKVAMPGDIEATIDTHADIVEALGRGDVEEYRRLVDQHYEPLRRAIKANEA